MTARALSPYLEKALRLLTFSARSRPGQRLGIEGDVADHKVEGVEIAAQFLDNGVERQALSLQFLQDGPFALGRVPALEKIVEASEAIAQRTLCEIAERLRDERAVLVEVFHPLGDDGGAEAIYVDLLLWPVRGRQGRVQLIHDGLRPPAISSGSGAPSSSEASSGPVSTGGRCGSRPSAR